MLSQRILFIGLFISLTSVALAQKGDVVPEKKVDTWGLYTGEYSIDLAKKFEWDWEYEKAIWIYINMMDSPEKPAAVKRVKGLKAKVGNLEEFINITFDTYVVHDPEVQEKVDGEVVMNPELFDEKRKLADALISAVQ